MVGKLVRDRFGAVGTVVEWHELAGYCLLRMLGTEPHRAPLHGVGVAGLGLAHWPIGGRCQVRLLECAFVAL